MRKITFNITKIYFILSYIYLTIIIITNSPPCFFEVLLLSFIIIVIISLIKDKIWAYAFTAIAMFFIAIINLIFVILVLGNTHIGERLNIHPINSFLFESFKLELFSLTFILLYYFSQKTLKGAK